MRRRLVMLGDRHRANRVRQGLLLAGVALPLFAVAASPAAAQAPVPLIVPTPDIETRPLQEDGLGPDGVFVDAQVASRDGDLITAMGSPEARALLRTGGGTLRADRFTYDLRDRLVGASGQVELVGPNGDVVQASRLELDSELRTGFAVDLASRLANGASLMAATAVRRSPTVNALNYVVFTPCPICTDEGEPKTPTVSIQAHTAIQDENLRAILFRDAVLRVGGVPVFYLPVLGIPDPTVERASGFLLPEINYDEGRGLSVEVPYLFVVSPSQDWLVSPQINSDVSPFLNLQWRRRFATGTIVARGGYTHARNFGDFDLDGDGDAESNVQFGDRTSRSYLLAYGAFDPDGPWRWGFTAERVSDKTLFDRYRIRDPYQDNGLYYGDERRLISQLYAERQTRRSYFSIAAFTIQSLRVVEFNDVTAALNVFEDDGTLPVAAPLMEYRWEPQNPILGGRLRVQASAASLYRQNFVGLPILRPEAIPPGPTDGLPGVDSRRLTTRGEWRRVLLSPMGLRYEPFVDTRLDVYSVADLPDFLTPGDAVITRGRATLGLDVAYPLIRRLAEGADIVVEPMAQVSISNPNDPDVRIPIEDTQTFELDESSLFRTDRLPGFDLYEGGARLTLGTRTTLRWAQDRTASLFVGRSLRDDDDPSFRFPIPDDPARTFDPSGLASQSTDWVVQATFAPSDAVRGWAHATLDGAGEIRRAEATVDAQWGRRNLAAVSYIIDRSNPVDGPLNRNYEFIQLQGQQFLRGPWGVSVAGIADLERDVVTRSEVGLLFDDDCLRFEIGYRRDNTRVRPTGPSDGVYVRLNLATFGGSGYGAGAGR